MKIKILLIAGLLSTSFYAQEKYRIVYDYSTDATSYYKLSKNNTVSDTLLNPKFKRNSLVEIQLKNVNPFAIDVEADVQEDEIHKSGGGFNFGSLLSGFGGMTGGELKINPQNLPEDNQVFSRGKSRGASDLNEMNEIITNVDAIKTTLRANMSNPNMNKEEIINNLKNLAVKIDDSRLGDPNENFYLFLSTLDRIVQEYKSAINSEISLMYKEVDSASANSVVVSRGATTLYRSLQKTQSDIDASTSQVSSKIDDIQNMYKALESSTFDITFDYLLEADKADVQLNFKPSEFSNNSSKSLSENTLKTRNIRLFSQGGFKINTSVALTMTNFGDNSNDYYLDQNGIIQADKNDHFVPSLGMMVNFYPMLSENFNIGGSFGLAIPITDDIKGINFLLGPSIYFGNKNRLSINGGAAFGPVNKLTKGLKVGNEAAGISSLDNNTKTVYDIGYFFGVSFSIIDMN